MPGIHDVQEKVVDFLVHELGKDRDGVRIVKLSKTTDGGWECKAEVTELNDYLKKLGHPAIFDKNIYTINLDAELGVTGFAETASRERSYATEEREEA